MSNYDQDYYYEERRSGNSFALLPLGLIVGVALGPLYFSNPQIFLEARDWLHETILGFIPDFPQYVTPAMFVLALIALILFRRLVRKLWLWTGLALGVGLWIPLGAHAIFYVPEVGNYFPKAETELTLIVAKNEYFASARNWAVEMIPIPPEAVPSLSEALAADGASGEPATNE